LSWRSRLYLARDLARYHYQQNGRSHEMHHATTGAGSSAQTTGVLDTFLDMLMIQPCGINHVS